VSHPTPATGSREELVQRLLAGVDEGHDLATSIDVGVGFGFDVDIDVIGLLLRSSCCSFFSVAAAVATTLACCTASPQAS
jgi:hypothetical protein